MNIEDVRENAALARHPLRTLAFRYLALGALQDRFINALADGTYVGDPSEAARVLRKTSESLREVPPPY